MLTAHLKGPKKDGKRDTIYYATHKELVDGLNDATTAESGLMSAEDKVKLNSLTNYNLTPATSSSLGGVITGANITNNDGTISVTKSNVENALGYTPSAIMSDATVSKSGLMSASDKTKLDGLENYTLPDATSDTTGGVKIYDDLGAVCKPK